MAWSTPMTAVANTSLTAAQWNASVRDNLLETAVAKATANSWPTIYTGTGANALAERTIQDKIIDTQETTTSTTFADLTTVGPQLVVTTGAFVLIFHNAQLSSSLAGGICLSSIDIDAGGASDARAIIGTSGTTNDPFRASAANLFGVGAGSHTFTMKYRVVTGTGTFKFRRMQVMAL